MSNHYPHCDCFDAFYQWEDRFEGVDDDDRDHLKRLDSLPLTWAEMIPHQDDYSSDKHSHAFAKAQQIIEDAKKQCARKLVFRTLMSSDEYQDLVAVPKSIGDLGDLKELDLYASNLTFIPREISKCTSLRKFVSYTSYRLHWFPYEITQCLSLVDSTVSTRALYGNYKFRPPFPNLRRHRISVYDDDPWCSICRKRGQVMDFHQYWISLPVATDVIPLLITVCSDSCLKEVGHSPEGYIQGTHEGGLEVVQPPIEGK